MERTLHHTISPVVIMAGNRKNQSGAVRFVPALKAVLLCTLIGGSCVGYVLQKNRIFEIGQQIGERQKKLERLQLANKEFSDRLAAMQVPQRLAERVKELKLGLVPPHPTQRVWIVEAPLRSPPPGTNTGPVHFVQLNGKP
jgi:hypothetical protein